MTQEELNNIVERHQHWINRDCEGWELMQADLRGATLDDVNLKGANLIYINLGSATLRRANLSGANLRGANLKGAQLIRADLSNSYLQDANLSESNLSKANLSGANLNGANLNRAYLDYSETCRFGTILSEPMKGYKKTAEGNIIELEIPKGAIVFSINNNKCRTNKVKVTKCEGIQHSISNSKFIYKENDTIEVMHFNLQYNVECGEGIHFFRTKEEAEEYSMVILSKINNGVTAIDTCITIDKQ